MMSAERERGIFSSFLGEGAGEEGERRGRRVTRKGEEGREREGETAVTDGL